MGSLKPLPANANDPRLDQPPDKMSGADILAALEGVAASTGSACHSGRVELSPVLRAMGISEHVGMGAVRFSLGHTTTADEITEVVERVSNFLLGS
jgi:cysteine desulfurase